MNKNLKTLMIIFSAGLNIVCIGFYFSHILTLPSPVVSNSNQNCHLYEKLRLNREQLNKFGSLRESFHIFVNEQGRKIKVRQIELVDLLTVKPPDREAIDAKQVEIQALQRQMQARVIDHLLEESKIFTPEQRQKFFAIIKGRMKASRSPRPRWMPQTTKSRPPECERP